MDDWTYTNEKKVLITKILSQLGLGRNLMVQCLEIYYFLDLEKLEIIYKNLSLNQKKASQGKALFEIIKFKKSYL